MIARRLRPLIETSLHSHSLLDLETWEDILGHVHETITGVGPRTILLIDYHGGLRYPHLVRDESTPARLDDIPAPRP